MPISKSTEVFNLVKSLSTAEKRNFRLYAKRILSSDNLLFLRLFDIMDKQKSLDENELLKQMGGITKGQYANIKRHLYKQMISSLRMLHKEKKANFQVREYLDYTYILYGKGLYLQALKILRKAKKIAQQHHLIYMQLTLLEFEKKIESRHITRSGINQGTILIEESTHLQQNADHLVRLSNLRIKIHAKYLQTGHIRNKKEAQQIKEYYHKELEPINLKSLGLNEKIYYVQSRVWYNYILLDFKSCMKYAIEWVTILEQNPKIIERDVDLYMRGYHYILTTAIHMKDKKTHHFFLEKFENYRTRTYKKFNANSQILSFLYVHTGRLDSIILNGNYDSADKILLKTQARIRKYGYKLDPHRIMVFYYKFAWINLGNGNITKAITHLDKIINNELKKLREDLQNYARIMKLMCHYDLGNIGILEYLLNTYSNYFDRKKGLNTFLIHAIKLFKELRTKGVSDHREILERYLSVFNKIKKDPYEKRAFVYLDIQSWIISKIRNESIQTVTQNYDLH